MSSTGCFAKDNLNKVTSRIQEPILLSQLPIELSEHNIWYEFDKNGYLTILKKDLHIVNSITNKIMQNILPSGKSFLPVSDYRKNCLITFFKNKKIPYKTKQIGNKTWLILEEGNHENYFGVCNNSK